MIKLSPLWSLPLLCLLHACSNDAEFGGGSGRSGSDATGTTDGSGSTDSTGTDGTTDSTTDGTNTDPRPGIHFTSLNWFWQCSALPGDVPQSDSAEDAVVAGKGPHRFGREQLEDTPVIFSGRVCPPAQVARDIVFVIDTSGSMSNNDPLTAGTCGRLNALQQVIAAASAEGTTHFGVVTFSSGVDATSTALVATEGELFVDITGGRPETIASDICADNGGTNYNAGLSKAADLLRLGREGATKEIYFVSDGQPDPADQDGVAIANTMKGVGVNVGKKFIPVTIATVMLAGVDKVMAKSIASKGANGLPLHANVAETDELTKVLTELSQNDIASALFRYRAIGQPKWTDIDIMPYMDDFNFSLPPITIDVEDPAAGIEVQYAYKDTHGQVTTSGGKLEWTADGGN